MSEKSDETAKMLFDGYPVGTRIEWRTSLRGYHGVIARVEDRDGGGHWFWVKWEGYGHTGPYTKANLDDHVKVVNQ